MFDSFKLLLLIYLYNLHPFFLQLIRMNLQRVLLNLKHIFLLIYFPLLLIHLQVSYFHFFKADLAPFRYIFLTLRTKLHKYLRDLYLILSLKIFHHTPLEQFLDFYHIPPLNSFFHFQFIRMQTNSNDSLTKHYQGLLFPINHKRMFNHNSENQDCLSQIHLHYLLQNHHNSKNYSQM